MVLVKQAPRTYYDVSFMITRQCDLECAFCMYDSSPRAKDRLDIEVSKSFIKSLEMDSINSFGFYGGEPAVAMKEFGEVAFLLPPNKPKFVITNGAWSTTPKACQNFISWCRTHSFQAFVSSTPYHQKFQDRALLVELEKEHSWLTLKEPEKKGDFIPMGKLAHLPVNCTQMCVKHHRPTRIAVQPDGSVIFQNCDGKYPLIGQASEGFTVIRERIEEMYKVGFDSVCPYFKSKEFSTRDS